MRFSGGSGVPKSSSLLKVLSDQLECQRQTLGDARSHCFLSFLCKLELLREHQQYMDKMHQIFVVYGVTMVISMSNSPSMVMSRLQQFGCLSMSGLFLVAHVPNSLQIQVLWSRCSISTVRALKNLLVPRYLPRPTNSHSLCTPPTPTFNGGGCIASNSTALHPSSLLCVHKFC